MGAPFQSPDNSDCVIRDNIPLTAKGVNTVDSNISNGFVSDLSLAYIRFLVHR